MQDSFKIKQDLTFAEFLSSTLYYYFSSRLLKRFILILIGCILLMMFLDISTTPHDLTFSIVLVNFSPVVILLLVVIIFAFSLCLYIYKSKPYLFENVSYDFTHWGIIRHGERTEFSKPWRDITKLKESKAFFLFYIGKIDFHIIQKRMFADTEELNNFRLFLNDKLKS